MRGRRKRLEVVGRELAGRHGVTPRSVMAILVGCSSWCSGNLLERIAVSRDEAK